MKRLILTLTLITSHILLTSCEESVPRNRPTIINSTSKVVTEPPTTTELPIPQRPDGAVIINSGFCGCQNGEPLFSNETCTSTCAARQQSNDASETLFFEVSVNEEISEGIYEDLGGWCSQEIINPNSGEAVSTNVSCRAEVKNRNGEIVDNLEFTPRDGTVQQLNIVTLDFDQTYRITLYETTSEARSTTIQVQKETETDNFFKKGPLMMTPVSQFTCIYRPTPIFDEVTGELIITDINRFHFFFNSATRPEPLKQSTTQTVYCHDIERFNAPVASPLLEETTGAYTVWDSNDPRFFDLNGDPGNTIDINEIILQKIELQGATLSSAPNLFVPLSWPSGIDDGDSTGGDNNTVTINVLTKELGYVMNPFLDEENGFKSYCPKETMYYNSSNPLFNALRDLVGDTEALYAGKQQNVLDYILVRESILKDIWFYEEGGQKIKPTDTTIQGKTIQFYWPADPSSPYIKKTHQRVYTLTSADELSGNNTVSTGSTNSNAVRTNYPTHDKRIACIPVLLK